MLRNFFNYYGFASILILLMLLGSYPYVFHILFDLPDDRFMGILFLILVSLFTLFSNKHFCELPSALINLMVVQSVVWGMYYVMLSDTSYLVRIFFILLAGLSIAYLLKEGRMVRFTKLYNYSLAVQGVLGVVAFFLVLVNILQPIFVHYYSEYRYLYCYGITCSNAVLGNIMRVGAFFDEPGAFAFWGVFALLFNKYTYDNQKLEIVLIVSLLFTFSAAFFVVLPVYLLCFYYNKMRSMFAIALILVPIVYITVNNLSGNSDFAHITIDRFSGGEIRSTRYDQTDYTKELFERSPVFGIGAKNMEQFTESTDNPYEVLAKDGIVGFFFTYLPLFFVSFKYRKDKRVLFGTLVLMLDYMQRPFHINEMHFFILYLYCTLIIMIKDKTNLFQYERSSINDLP